jgi:hypothetical protein
MVEAGKDVLLVLDGLHPPDRAYNLAMPSSGRTLSGGIDPVALHPAKKFFGAARNVDGGGSLTILATCLVDTGSRMDDLIYEEFKGTGNMELHLDRRLAERGVFPAVDITRSGTRREDLLLSPETIRQVQLLKRMMSMISAIPSTPWKRRKECWSGFARHAPMPIPGEPGQGKIIYKIYNIYNTCIVPFFEPEKGIFCLPVRMISAEAVCGKSRSHMSSCLSLCHPRE